MSNRKMELTPSGTPVYRYEARTKPFEAASETPDIEKIQQHVEKHLGKIDSVYHELVSDLVHVDVFFIKPTAARNFVTLITSGMSYRPTKAPAGAKQCKYAELMACLPPDWPLSDNALKDENNYWPIRQLKMLARLPHEYDTWLWYGHTVPNADPARPYSKNTKLSGIIIAPPLSAPEDFSTLRIDENKTIYFFSILPLYQGEMNFKLRQGSDKLFDRLDKHGIRDLVDIRRHDVCRSGLWPF